MGRAQHSILLTLCLTLYTLVTLTVGNAFFQDCPPKGSTAPRVFGFLRRCCKSPQLPKGCECFDISVSTPFINSLYHKPQCPEGLAVRFLLYTRLNRDQGVLVRVGDTSLTDSSFQGSKPTKFIIHGFTDLAPNEWSAAMTTAILNLEDVNVILVDWRDGAKVPNYFQAVANVRSVGAMVATLVQEMTQRHGALLGSFHLIGHSLGAHVSGMAGKEITRLTHGLLGRISGLDPAGFCFENHSSVIRLDKSDASFVDVIHTDAQPLMKPGFGIQHSIGHVDFYPNGGTHQPGCPEERGGILSLFDYQHTTTQDWSAGVCSHARCVLYYAGTIGRCVSNTLLIGGAGPRCIMGYHTNTSCRGEFFPQTNAFPPYFNC